MKVEVEAVFLDFWGSGWDRFGLSPATELCMIKRSSPSRLWYWCYHGGTGSLFGRKPQLLCSVDFPARTDYYMLFTGRGLAQSFVDVLVEERDILACDAFLFAEQ